MKLSITNGIAALLLGSLLSGGCSCKKDNDVTPQGFNYRVKKVTEIDIDGHTTTYDMTYNHAGQLTSIVQFLVGSTTPFTYTYTHTAGYVIVQKGLGAYYDSITKNANGMAGQLYYLLRRPGQTPEVHSISVYEYGNDSLIDRITYPGYPNIDNFYAANGDIDSVNNSGSGYKCVYDLAHASQPGDIQMWSQLRAYGGVDYMRTAHLWRGSLGGMLIDYHFDATNRIDTATPVNGDFAGTIKFIFEYEDL
jgi:hypothetical protein